MSTRQPDIGARLNTVTTGTPSSVVVACTPSLPRASCVSMSGEAWRPTIFSGLGLRATA